MRKTKELHIKINKTIEKMKVNISRCREFLPLVDGLEDLVETYRRAPGWYIKIQKGKRWKELIKYYREVEIQEREEGYPNIKKLKRFFDTIRPFMPENSKGCYFYSGPDIYLSTLFKETYFIDHSFHKLDDPLMWFPPEFYSKQKLQQIETLLKNLEFTSEENKIHCIPRDGSNKRENKQYNNQDHTLILKGDELVLKLLNMLFDKKLDFECICIISPALTFMFESKLINKIEKRGYKLVFSDKTTEICVPFAMPYHHFYIFRKK